MHTIARTLPVLLLLILASCTEPAPVTVEQGSPTPTAPMSVRDAGATDRYIVVFRDDVAAVDALIDELRENHGLDVRFRYRHALKGFAAQIPPQALEGLRRNPRIAFIEADGEMHEHSQSNPPSWGLDRVDQRQRPLDNLYTWPNTGSGVTVYIIDSGIRMDHQEFTGRVSSGWDFIDNDADASDCRGHGTHVAGTVAGSTTGVAKGASLVSVRVLDCSGYGSYSAIIAGIDWVTANRRLPAVANMSLGGPVSSAVNQAVTNSIAAGVVYAVSAGNDNADASTKSPASTPAALTVGATGSTDARASYSNYGTCVDLFAPGSSITSATMDGTGTYGAKSGTSMASPHVAGVAALYLAANPSATPAQVCAAIVGGATPGVVTGEGTGSPNLLLYNQPGTSSAPPPAAPTALSAVLSAQNAATLTWTDNATTETRFDIERSTTGGSSWSALATVGANITSFVDAGLSGGVTYTYRVRAAHSTGASGWSNTASVSTPVIVTSVHVAAITGGTSGSSSKWQAKATVTVHDAAHLPVAGATVSVTWAGGTLTGVTGSNGKVTVSTPRLGSATSSVTMTVAGISGSNIQYNATANHVNPATVVVLRP